MKIENLINKGLALEGWHGETVAELGDVKARLFHLTPNKEMVMDEEGHNTNEWILILSGTVIVQTPGARLVLTAGDSLVLPPGVSHRLNVDADAVGLVVRDMRKDPANTAPGIVVDKDK